jgi:DNA-binding transcriptional ArsR family regulator
MDMTTAVVCLGALAQESRLAIYRLLVEEGARGLCVGDIGEQTDIAAATLSFHLKELTHAKLLKARREGRLIYYSPDFEVMNELQGFLTENCCRGADCAVVCTPKPKSVGRTRMATKHKQPKSKPKSRK